MGTESGDEAAENMSTILGEQTHSEAQEDRETKSASGLIDI